MWAEFFPLSSCCRDMGRGTTKTLGEMPLIGPHDLAWAASCHSETSGPWSWRAGFCQHQCWKGDQDVGGKIEEWPWGVWKEPLGKGLCEPEAWFSPHQPRSTVLNVCVQNCKRKTRTLILSIFSNRFLLFKKQPALLYLKFNFLQNFTFTVSRSL